MQYANKTDTEVREEWGRDFIRKGLTTFQRLITASTDEEDSRYSVGNQVTFADIVLIPQLYNATRFGINVAMEFPRLLETEEHFKTDFSEPYFKAHPDTQIDNSFNVN